MAGTRGQCESCGGILNIEPIFKTAACPFCGSTFASQVAIDNYNINISINSLHALNEQYNALNENINRIDNDLNSINAKISSMNRKDGLFSVLLVVDLLAFFFCIFVGLIFLLVAKDAFDVVLLVLFGAHTLALIVPVFFYCKRTKRETLYKKEASILKQNKEEMVLKQTELVSQIDALNIEIQRRQKEIEREKVVCSAPYTAPSVCLLRPDYYSPEKKTDYNKNIETAHIIENTLRAFGIEGFIVNIQQGASWTRFELVPQIGVRINSILYHKKDLQLQLGVKHLEIEAPIPGKNTIGIDIPNSDKCYLSLYDLVDSKEFKRASDTACIIGKERLGELLICDFSGIQHILITGSDYREVAMMRDSLLCSLLFKATPKSIRMIMIDTKMVEMGIYNGIPHLETPVITNKWCVPEVIEWINAEMQRRFALFNQEFVKSLSEYNRKYKYRLEAVLPHIILIINEADDLDYEIVEKNHLLSSIINKSAIVGIHIIACCRTNSRKRIFQILNEKITTKIVFMIPSQETSKTVINHAGAETLDGNGEFYYMKTGLSKPLRGICAKVEESEILSVVGDLKEKNTPLYSVPKVQLNTPLYSVPEVQLNTPNETQDIDLFDQAVETVLTYGSASVSVLNRRLGITYPRAARLIDELEKRHIIGPFEGNRPRKILITETEWIETKAKKIK